MGMYICCNIGELDVDACGEMVYGYTDERKNRNRFKFFCTGISAICYLLFNASECLVFSSTGRRPASYCHGVVSVCLFVLVWVRVCVRKLFLEKTSPQKLLTGFLQNFTGMFLRWSSFKFLQIIMFYEEFWLPWQSK